MKDFKFAIGDVVRLAISARQKNTSKYVNKPHEEVRGTIVERIMTECSGGIQRSYAIRFVQSNGNFLDKLYHFNEIELVASEPFEGGDN